MTFSDVLVFAGIFLCLCLSSFCSASEMAFSSCNLLRLENARDAGSRRARAAVYIAEHFDDALSAILIGNNLANIGSSSLASVAVILVTGSDGYAWVSTVAITLLVIIFGETMPKITAKQNANSTALKNAYAVRGMMIIFYPLVWVVVMLIKLITMGMKPDGSADSAPYNLTADTLDPDQNYMHLYADSGFVTSSAPSLLLALISSGPLTPKCVNSISPKSEYSFFLPFLIVTLTFFNDKPCNSFT